MEKPNFNKENGLIPAIVQDEQSRKVLMLGYMNEEALQKTRATGEVTFYSRSRKTLWTKGKTSGNTLYLSKILIDCDQDTLLILARPAGPVCHKGTDTCFNEINEAGLLFIEYLENLIIDRKHKLPVDSYTAKLFRGGAEKIAQKVGEEAVELVIEAMKTADDRFLNEAADLVYHLLVLLAERGYALKDVAHVLEQRHQKEEK